MNIKIIRGGAASKERWDPPSIDHLRFKSPGKQLFVANWAGAHQPTHSSIVIEPRQLFDHAAG